MNKLQIFNNPEFGQIRTVSIKDKPYFIGKDIAEVLGYSETNAMTKRLDDEDFISAKLEGMNMKSTLINESGLYSAILGSQLSAAKKFKHWVTSEVLPTIRKTGGYVSNDDMFINTYLIEKGWTNKHLAELCRMTPEAVCRAIGHPLTTKFNTLAIIADKLGIGSIPIK